MIDWYQPDPASDLKPGYAGPPASFGETVEAARKQYDAARLSTAPTFYAGRLGKDVVAALKAKGRTGFTGADGRKVAYGDNSLRPDYALHPTVAPRIWADVAAERARDPGFLPGIGTPDEFDAAIIAARRKDYDEAGDVLGRSSGLTGLGGELVGGLLASFEDPLQLGVLAATAAFPAGRIGLGVIEKLFGGKVALGTATKIASEALGNAAVNVIGTVPTLPVTIGRSAEIGVEMTGGDIAMELAGAAVAGGVLGAAPPTLAAGARSVRRMVRDLRGLERPLTPAEADALPVLEQAAADIAASPFKPTPEGDAAHAGRLTEAVAALEQDRPVDPAVFEQPAPAVKAELIATETQKPVSEVFIPPQAAPGFDPSPHLDAAAAYVADKKAGPLTPEALGKALDITPDEAKDVFSRLASGDKGKGIRQQRIYGTPEGSKVRQVIGVRWQRVGVRQGYVDLITQLADMGGVNPNGGHSLIRSLGQRVVSGVGPVFRNSGMSLNDVGEFLMQNGWVRSGETGNGIPTEAEVIDLLDKAIRTKTYHPEEAALAMEADRAKLQAKDGQFAELSGQVRDTLDAFNDRNAEDGGKPVTLTDEDMAAIVTSLPDHATVEDAIFAHVDSIMREAEAEARATGLDDGFDDYADDVPFDGGDDAGSNSAPGEDGAGQSLGAGDARQGEPGGRVIDPANPPPANATDAAAGAEALTAFDQPHGEGPVAQVESLAHDLRAQVGQPAPVAMAAAKSADEIAAARVAFAEAGGAVGPHGPIHADLTTDYAGAVARLTNDQDGEVPGVLSHQDVGEIDLIYGEAGTNEGNGAGLAKLLAWHPEVVADLPTILQGMAIRTKSANRINLESALYRAAVRLDFDGQKKTWLLTAFEKKKGASGATQDRPAAPLPPGRTNYSGSERGADIAPAAGGDNATGSLGLDAEQAAAAGGMTEAQRAEMAVRLQQSQIRRGGQVAADQQAGGLFDAARDQLDAFGFAMPDGSTQTPGGLLAEIDADDAALKTIRDCL